MEVGRPRDGDAAAGRDGTVTNEKGSSKTVEDAGMASYGTTICSSEEQAGWTSQGS